MGGKKPLEGAHRRGGREAVIGVAANGGAIDVVGGVVVVDVESRAAVGQNAQEAGHRGSTTAVGCGADFVV